MGREGLPVRCVFLLNPFHNGAISASGWPGADPGRFRTRPADGSPGGVGSRPTGRRRRRPRRCRCSRRPMMVMMTMMVGDDDDKDEDEDEDEDDDN